MWLVSGHTHDSSREARRGAGAPCGSGSVGLFILDIRHVILPLISLGKFPWSQYLSCSELVRVAIFFTGKQRGNPFYLEDARAAKRKKKWASWGPNPNTPIAMDDKGEL